MSDPKTTSPRAVSVLPLPTTPFLFWVSLAVPVVIGTLGLGLGFAQGQSAQIVILSTIVTVAVLLWLTGALLQTLEARFSDQEVEADGPPKPTWWQTNRVLVLAMIGMLLVYLALTASIPAFRSITNLIAFLILEIILVFAVKVSGRFGEGRSAFIGVIVLFALIVVSSFSIEGFLSVPNIRAILLFAAFLGIASVGQTLVALMGGLDLSIPFVIGSSNIGLALLFSLGVPSGVAVLFVLVIGAGFGLLNGVASYKLQGQALIVTLGTGFMLAGLTQGITTIVSAQGGNVVARLPGWLKNLAAMNGKFAGLPIPPAILIWILLAIIVICGLRYSGYGRSLYALGGNRQSARLTGISEFKYWCGAYALSGFFAAATGCLLLGWSGGGFVGVGDPYLFLTLTAVVIGGTSLAGGSGGYGFTVIGVLVLQVLSTFLIGIGLKYEWQQFIFGLLILPMVALYGRAPKISAQV